MSLRRIELMYFSPDIMGDLVFGKSFGTLAAKPENRDAIRLLGRAARRNYTIGAMPFLHKSGLERWLPPFRGLFLDRLQYLALENVKSWNGLKTLRSRIRDEKTFSTISWAQGTQRLAKACRGVICGWRATP